MRKILVLNRLGIGDVVVTTPLAQLLKEHFAAQVGFAVAKKAEDVLRNHPYIDDVFGCQKKNRREVVERIQQAGYQEALVVDERLSSSLIAWKAGCKLLNVGKEVSLGIRRIFIRKQRALRASEDFSSYIQKLDPKISYAGVKPRIGDMDEARRPFLQDWLACYFKESRALVLIVPRSAADNKNWPIASFGRLNRYLNDRAVIPVYLGAPGDKAYIEQIPGNKVNAAGVFSMRELPVLAQSARFAVSVCTGPLHILGTAGVPILAIYGQGEPRRWAPDSAIVVQSTLPCVPCLRLDCSQSVGQTCMDEIQPERIFAIIEKQQWMSR